MKRSRLLQVVLGAALLGGAALSNAALITIDWTDSGWYSSDGFHSPNNGNYISSNIQHNFFVFDLSSITDPIVGATLRLNTVDVTASAPYNLYDVTTDIATLRAGGSGLTGIYNDLGSGNLYGSTFISSGMDNQDIDINLNALAISSLNGAASLWAIGGDFDTTSGYAFGFSGSFIHTRQLIITTQEDSVGTVPEPGSLALVGLGLLSLLWSRWRMRL